MASAPRDLSGLVREFARFATVGGAGFIVDNAIVYGMRGAIGLYWAGAVAYLAAASVNWLINRLWTFRGRGTRPAHQQWALFLVANLVGFVLNRGTFAVAVALLPIAAAYPVLAIAAGTAVGMLFNFHLARRFVFR